jgi:hypothetical protein
MVSRQRNDAGTVVLDVSRQYIDQSQARIGRHNADIGEISGHHDEVFTTSRIETVRLGVGLSPRWALDVALPYIHREHQHVHHHKGEELLESWNYEGLGDVSAQARYMFLKPVSDGLPHLSLSAGAVLPTGKTNAKGLSQDETGSLSSEEAEVGIQPGAGTTSLLVGGSSMQRFTVPTLRGGHGVMPLFVNAVYRFNGQSAENYKIGNSLVASLGTLYPLFPRLGFSTQVNLRYARQDDKGSTREEVDKTGGTHLYVSPGVELSLADNVGAYLTVQLPVYENVRSIQLVSRYNLIMGVSYKFGLWD